ncbi:MAG: cytochrome c3 family protein [Planctomycetes bacterium]|jgi:hypothetical protein|nr:cytochrome c3 family protein [Planctomycetota bacterium]
MNIFPAWTNTIRPHLVLGALGALVYVTVVITYGMSPKTLYRGYQPEQPIAFSHKLHAGDLAIDCRYCHSTVEVSAEAAIPPSSVCMNCHARIAPESPKLELLRDVTLSGEAVPWVRVHDLPDFVYFDHSAHVRRGVGCMTCHGRIDTMETVYQHEPLSMSWCITCHRDPTPHLRPLDKITDMTWTAPSADFGANFARENGIKPNQNCSTCHR